MGTNLVVEFTNETKGYHGTYTALFHDFEVAYKFIEMMKAYYIKSGNMSVFRHEVIVLHEVNY